MSLAPWPAPAKLNLFLHITGRRADGYHLLQTVFQILDYGDDLSFTPRDDGQIHCTGNHVGIAREEDLIVQAASLLQKEAGGGQGVDIVVNKRLPLGGGLGGGSSDAATTLVALNHIWRLGLGLEALAGLGLGLGADVPVFIHGRAAWAEGVGELLTPVALPERWFLVVNPGVSVATGRVFNAPDLTRNTPAITIRDFLAGSGRNDCERVVRELYPEVAALLDWLGGKAAARMTGTGSCVFAPFDSKEAAAAVLAELPEPWEGFVAQGRNRSPLLARLDSE